MSASPRCVDPVLQNMDFASFSKQYEVDSANSSLSNESSMSDKNASAEPSQNNQEGTGNADAEKENNETGKTQNSEETDVTSPGQTTSKTQYPFTQVCKTLQHSLVNKICDDELSCSFIQIHHFTQNKLIGYN